MFFAKFSLDLKDQVRVFWAMLFGYFPMKREDFTRVYNPNRGLRVSSIKRYIIKIVTRELM